MEAENLVNNIIEKSQEAFLLAIEIYNKPTINGLERAKFIN